MRLAILTLAISLAHAKTTFPDMSLNIIRGTDATEVQPYLVSIQIENYLVKQHACGGSLLKPNKVLSAAHCLKAWGQLDYYAAFGYLKLSDPESPPERQIIKIIDYVKHPDYKSTGGEPNDVVIFTLEKDVALSPTVQFVQLSDLTVEQLMGKAVTLDGWGVTSSDPRARPADNLQHLELTVVDKEECKKAFNPSWILPQHICAINPGPEPKPDSCIGDSGGPLMYNGQQVGITSFGSPECGTNQPSVYGSIAALRSWIDANS